jgi:hypothetical protein
LGRLIVDLENNHGVGCNMIKDAPAPVFVGNADLVTSRSYVRHGSGVGQADAFALLQTPEQHAGLNPGLSGERRGFISPFIQTSGLPA